MRTKVFKLGTMLPVEVKEYDLDPTTAVITAYAESVGDMNVDGYQTKYGHLLYTTNVSVCCAPFAAFRLLKFSE